MNIKCLIRYLNKFPSDAQVYVESECCPIPIIMKYCTVSETLDPNILQHVLLAGEIPAYRRKYIDTSMTYGIEMDTTQKHYKFLKCLQELLHEHQVDLVLLPDDEQGAVKLSLVSDGVFKKLVGINPISDKHVYLCIQQGAPK